MSNSPLICYSKISPNRNSPRSGKIRGIAIHCMAGQLSVEGCGNLFAQADRSASSNYGIGPDGRIGMYVEERDRSWCTSTGLDNYVVTIEVASDSKPPYAVTEKAYASLIKLCADICKRNGFTLKWEANKALAGQWDRQNIILHRWFKNKACPGEWLESHMGEIVNRTNMLLAAGSGGSGNTTYCGKGIGEALCLSSDGMEVRTQGRTTAPSVGHVAKGQKVEVLQLLKIGWMKIVWPGDPRGYAYTSNVGGSYWKYTEYARKVVAHGVVFGLKSGQKLNVRTGPGTKYPLLPEWPQLANGNEVDVLDVLTAEDGSAWFEIRIAEKYIGCVASWYVKTTTIG